jgi:molybdopterin molybdotransferase
MISFDEAYSTVINSAIEIGIETIPFGESLNRVLRQDVISDIDMPPFDKATVDGFACRRSDVGRDLELVETIPAGRMPEIKIRENQCSRIMTGAAVPRGADMVFMVEDSAVLPSGMIRFTGTGTKDNISPRGEDVRNGDVILEEGSLIMPQHIALLALAGCTDVRVGKRPVVSVISSGDELVEPDVKPGLSQIRNTNSYQLMAQISKAGAIGMYMGIAGDDEDLTFGILNRAMEKSDVVLITGGVSMGDFDFVPSVMERAGIRILFSRVRIQPGKPTTFGVGEKARVFGLPGNPVSSFIQFELLVKPFLYRMMGYNWTPITLEMSMAESFTRRSSDRRAVIPVVFSRTGQVTPVEYHGSAHISAFSIAEGIITLPEGKNYLEKGEIVSVRQL